MRNTAASLIGWLLLAVTAAASERDFQQREFVISFWVDPRMDEQAELRYQEIADAHFSLVMGGFGASTPEQIQRQPISRYPSHLAESQHSFCSYGTHAPLA